MATVAQRLEADRLKYPALLPEDVLVWRAWLALHQGEYDRFDYNLLLGPAQDPGPAFDDTTRAMWIRLRKARVDVVAWRGAAGLSFGSPPTTAAAVYALKPEAQATIIEVKRRAGPSNIGQITSYYHLWVTENTGASLPALKMVCATFTPNIIAAVQANNISLDVVQADFSILRPLR